MFIGHFALGFAAKRVTPRISLAALFGAAQFADLLWPVLVAAGLEQVRIDPGNTASTPLDFVSYPYSHSLLALMVWGMVFAAIYRAWTRRRVVEGGRAFVMLFALVVSHWVLDVLVHRPDMPLYPGSAKLGLGLWNSPFVEKSLEVVMYAAGLLVYLRATKSRDWIGRWALWGLVAFLFFGYLASSTPPPSVRALWVTAILLGGLTLAWTWIADRHREAV
jgi:LexA-binding, inner membrane-associated putative hydrolase